MIKIAIVGGIGSGKSTVSKVLVDMGYSVLDCDRIYRDITESIEYLRIVEQNFPGVVKDNKLDRETLGNIVFSKKSELDRLNNIAHPLVMKKLNQLVVDLKEDIVFVEIQVINDTIKDYFDKILYVSADTKIRIQRIMKRSAYTKEHIKKIILNQPSEEQFERIADYIIINNKTESEIKNQLIKILNF